MNIKRALRKRLNESQETPKTFDEAVDMDKLEMFAKGLANICMGEYGNTYFNKEEMKIGIVVGDANPFDSFDTLEDWVRWECVDGPHDFIKEFDIEIDAEWQPSGDNWKRVKTK